MNRVTIVGGGLAGSEAALQLADMGFDVSLYEMRPVRATPVHKTDGLAELVCSNSLKSTKVDSAAGMLKEELAVLGSRLYEYAQQCRVDAGGALAVDRAAFSQSVTEAIEEHPHIRLFREEIDDLPAACADADALILATGPLTSDSLAESMRRMLGLEYLSFYDAAAPIVMADSIDMTRVFSQNRYEGEGEGDYLNCPFDKDGYDRFIEELISADRVLMKDFETRELFQACQPVEEIARKGVDALRFGALKPVGLSDPQTGRRPWAAVQLRAENAHGMSFNLVGFQTNLTFPEQRRVFRMIPGLEHAEFARYGVMHRNTYLDAPRLLEKTGRVRAQRAADVPIPLYVAGQLAGTEGYCEAIRSGLHVAISVAAQVRGLNPPNLPSETVFGALMEYANDPQTSDYQPMHVNFGLMPPLEEPPRNKRQRYAAYAKRGAAALADYAQEVHRMHLLAEST